VIQDLNNSTTIDNIVFYQPAFKDVDINWHTLPPFDGTSDINFNLVYYDENGKEISFDGTFIMTLFDSEHKKITDFNVTGTNTITIEKSHISKTGKYYLSIGD